MKKYPTIVALIAAIVAQQVAMIIFMRVVHLDIFLSAGLAMLVGFAAGFIGWMAARKTGQ